MKHDSVYLGGVSRGDTPPRDIPTLGAAGGRPKVSEMTMKELAKPCPYARDENLRMLARHEKMTMDCLRKEDVPPGPILFNKDYDRSLMTEDLELAQPMLGHPSSCAGVPIPWKYLQKQELPEVPNSCPKQHYPPIKRRVRDLSLKTDDIEFAQPKKSNMKPRDRSGCIIDPITPSYQFTSYDAPPPAEYRASGRCTLDVSDIDGAQPKHAFAVRNQYGDPLKCEAEFRNPRHHAVLADAAASFIGSGHMTPRAPGHGQATPRRRIPEPEVDVKPQVRHREGHPLEPRYHLPVSAGAGSSVHVRFETERRELGDDPPPCVVEEVGHVEGSKPRTGVRDNGEPQNSLCTHDLPGARPQRRAGVLPIHMYGPPGVRPAQSARLDTSDIVGAQADTRSRGPRRTPRGMDSQTPRSQVPPAFPQPPVPRGALQAQTPRADMEGRRPPSAGGHQATLRFADGVEAY
eukprot:gb/GFBE01042399.1/.p1 GENE.gb/GFBE01042399.1/~~gb/GFBE01042399.1/.p1  ORF type:complete len:461 (+),score=44.79 gb/GFBE01042399.1/:1-1383(+)